MQEMEPGHEHSINHEGNLEEQKQPLISRNTQTKRETTTKRETLSQGAGQPQLLMPSAGSVAISYLAGTIMTDEILRFKKMVYRATRGKALTYFQEMAASGLHDYAGKQDNRQRSVYVIIFQEGATMRDKLIKICDSFLGKNFDIPPGCE